MFELLFKLYLKNLERLGGFYGLLTLKTASLLRAPKAETPLVKQATGELRPATFDDLDKQATRLGNSYRGIGVLTGMLTVGIFFFSTLPGALPMPPPLQKTSEALQVACMVAIVCLLFYSRHHGKKECWIAPRVAAERLRYRDLHQMISEAQARPSVRDASTLRNASLAVIEGKNGQLAYHQKGAKKFDAILHGSRLFTLLSIALSLVAAAIHLYLPLPWLLFLIAFLPGMAGAMQGVNGFLGLAGLLSEHQMVAHKLSSLRNRLIDSIDPTTTLSLAGELYEVLIGETAVWGKIAEDNFNL